MIHLIIFIASIWVIIGLLGAIIFFRFVENNFSSFLEVLGIILLSCFLGLFFFLFSIKEVLVCFDSEIIELLTKESHLW